MPISQDKIQLTFAFEKDLTKKIDELAKKVDVTRAQMIRNLVKMGLEDAMTLNALGLVSATSVMRDMFDAIFQGRFKKVEKGIFIEY